MQLKGTVIKNNISSIGRLIISIPKVYALLNAQSPLAVTNESQTTKDVPTVNIEKNKFLNFL